MEVLDARTAVARSATAYSLWVRWTDAHRVRLPAPWISRGNPEMVNGVRALGFIHPPRQEALRRMMDDEPMSDEQAIYVAQYLTH